jgi:hypothetical protein
MRSIPSKTRRPNLVMAMFEDGMTTFPLSRDATFEDLAGRLARLGKQHQGKAIAFKVKFGSLPLTAGPRRFEAGERP